MSINKDFPNYTKIRAKVKVVTSPKYRYTLGPNRTARRSAVARARQAPFLLKKEQQERERQIIVEKRREKILKRIAARAQAKKIERYAKNRKEPNRVKRNRKETSRS